MRRIRGHHPADVSSTIGALPGGVVAMWRTNAMLEIALIGDLEAHAAERIGGEPALVVHERHRIIFADALSALDQALAIPEWEGAAELVSEALRAALGALGRSRGRIGTEAMLDRLFSTFCIGK